MKITRMMMVLVFVLSAAGSVIAGSKSAPLTDDELLEQVARQAFDFFWFEADPHTGLIPDGTHTGEACSIASVGFGLASLCVADSRGWITHRQAYDRVLKTLQSFQAQTSQPDSALVEGKYGMFFHFVNTRTGKWDYPRDCVSTADTAILMCGVITCLEYFKGTEIEKLADQLFRACQWDAFMQDNEGHTQDFIAMGYIPPERAPSADNCGFIGRYLGYGDNSFMITMLALASPTHPIPTSTWYASQSTYKWHDYQGQQVIATTPAGLAFHYYPHCWLDLRYLKDQAANYFQNTILAVKAQQEYCQNKALYPHGLWGLASCISAKGYEAFGAPWGNVVDDGTITPHAIVGGLLFTPEKSWAAMRYLYTHQAKRVWGKYGFTDAYNVKTQWSTPDVLGLDQGPIVVMIENYRSGLIWKTFMASPYIQNALKKIGFVGVIEDFEQPLGSSVYSQYRLVKGQASLRMDSVLRMEGAQSLFIQSSQMGEELIMEVQPRLRDFHSYSAVSVWGRNIHSLMLEMKDSRGQGRIIHPKTACAYGSWTKYIFPFFAKGQAAEDRVDSLRFSLTPGPEAPKEGMSLDGIVLTYLPEAKPPAPPQQFQVSTPRSNAIVKITLKQPKGAYQYDLRFSQQPIQIPKDFEQLAASSRLYLAYPYTPQKELYFTLPSTGQYYFAVQCLNAYGLRSRPVSAFPITVSSSQTQEMITDFGEGLESPCLRWAGPESIRLSVEKRPGEPGKRALAVHYTKTGAWDYFELNFTPPLDVRPYRYLRLRVWGQESMIAKLFNSTQQQEDISTLAALQANQWNEMRYDMSPNRQVDKKNIQKILFFVAPGRIRSGMIYIDEIWLAD